MDDNFIKALQEQARTTDVVKSELRQKERKEKEEFELEKERRINLTIETIHNTFQPLSNIVKTTAIEAAKKALYKEKNGQKILLGQVRLYFPYSTWDDKDYDGYCCCRFEKKQRNGFKSQMVYEYNKRGIVISKEKFWAMNLPKLYSDDDYWLVKQITKVIKEDFSKNVEGVFIEKNAHLSEDYNSSSYDHREYKLEFKIFF